MDYRTIEKNGFIHLKNIISNDDVKKLVFEFQSAEGISNKKYNIKRVANSSRDILRPYYLHIMEQLSSQTDLTLNTLADSGGAYFSTNDGVHDWHQDSLTYYLYQTHKNFVIFWTPIIKPTPSFGNLSLFPYGEFKKADEELFKRRKDKGAAHFYQKGSQNIFHLTDSGQDSILNVNFNLNELQVTPHVEVGDVLVMKGDLFHRTQIKSSDRVAISLYGLNQDTVLTLKDFECSGEYKKEYFEKNPEVYATLLAFFSRHQTATIKMLQEFLSSKNN